MLTPAVFSKLPAKTLYISSFVVAAEVIYKRTSKFASQIPQARCAFKNAKNNSKIALENTLCFLGRGSRRFTLSTTKLSAPRDIVARSRHSLNAYKCKIKTALSCKHEGLTLEDYTSKTLRVSSVAAVAA